MNRTQWAVLGNLLLLPMLTSGCGGTQATAPVKEPVTVEDASTISNEKPATDALTITNGEATVTVGDRVTVCVRTIAHVFDYGGAFTCGSTVVTQDSPLGPGVTEAALWKAILDGGADAKTIAAAYVYDLPTGSNPETETASSISLYDGQSEPSPRGLLTAYIVRVSDDSLRMYVGLIERT